ncbi:MAG: RluA family pseudouridine synthase [Clostridiales bacterium]|nr:RluA family pseudouridine synthase [Clostridiales bacterium]
MEKQLFVAEEPCKRLDVFLSEQMEDVTRSRIKKLIEDGCVCIGDKTVKKAGAEIRTGDEVTIEIPDAVEYALQAENIPIDIVYEDKDFAVVNKPKGMTVHVGNGVESGTLVNALLYALDSLSGIGGVLRPGIVHRIDKDTTGLLVVAKNDKAHVSLASQIAQKTCKRTYFALLEGNVKTDGGRVVTDIGRHPTDRLKMAVLSDGKGKIAVTDYEVVARFGTEFTLCKFDLQTGRTHQIRVHAKHLGHPVAGDPVYGYKKQKIKADGQLLHAWRLQLTHPTTGEEMAFTAPLPPTFAEILRKLCRQYAVETDGFSELLGKEK